MKTLDALEPKAVFRHFRTISAIPHCSNSEKPLSDRLVSFAEDLGLTVRQDDAYNVAIEKPASKGYEDAPKVILQGHIDMVCTKTSDSDVDFDKDGLSLYVEDGFLKADGTTLGADNGIAVAMIMAILEDSTLDHPPLTALFTVGEEIGMVGVSRMDPSMAEGDILINIDAEDEGVFYASCAGGVRNLVTLPVERNEAPQEETFKVKVNGLLGGHSGLEIDKGRGNAIHLLGRVLEALNNRMDYRLHAVSGGEKMNAIAKFADAHISLESGQAHKLETVLETMKRTFQDELASTDPAVTVSFEEASSELEPLDDASAHNLIGLLRLIPTGINTMSFDIDGLVESSTNLGVLTTEKDAIHFESAIRSAKKSLKGEIANRIARVAEAFSATSHLNASYPEWPFEKLSPIRDLMQKTYESLSGKPSRVSAIHGGLETGFLIEKLGRLDTVAIGPDIEDVHTPNEKLDIESTGRTYTLIVETLAAIDGGFQTL